MDEWMGANEWGIFLSRFDVARNHFDKVIKLCQSFGNYTPILPTLLPVVNCTLYLLGLTLHLLGRNFNLRGRTLQLGGRNFDL